MSSPDQQAALPHNRVRYAFGGVGPAQLTCPQCDSDEPVQCENCTRVEQAIRRDEARVRRAAVLSALGLTTRRESVNLKEQVDGY